MTHLDENGRPKMVDVSEKENTKRIAIAKGTIFMSRQTLEAIQNKTAAKGDVLSVAQTAGIMAAKNTWNTIPMCHNIFITGVSMNFEIDEDKSAVNIEAKATTTSKTGVEMEALNAVSVAALTIYDMCKAIDKSMTIGNIKLTYKEGGKSGVFVRGEVLSVNISKEKGTVKIPVCAEGAEFIESFGIKGDAHGGCDEIKQVSLLANESIDKMRSKGLELKCGDFAENITTSGINLHTLPIGTKLKIGETIQEVSRIGKECHKGCAIMEKTGTCIMPKEGIFTKVVVGGIVKAGDEIVAMSSR